ncbi:MAG: polysaccharide export protein [Rhodoferax sp.]|nr:polysaccharide export protein [Rhodoferax sp.]
MNKHLAISMDERRFPAFPSHLVAAVLPTVRGIKLLLLALATVAMSGCAAIPGSDARALRQQQSSIKLPVQQNGEEVPANVTVKTITAELIIEQTKALRAAATPNDIPAAASTNGAPSTGEGFGTRASADLNPQPMDYRVGPGDILTITVWDHPELTTPAGQYRSAQDSGTLVNEDGTLFFPYVGVVNVQGKSLAEVRQILSSRLGRYIERVQLDVRVNAFRSKRIYVVGEVAKPGLQEITDLPMTMLEAVNRVGGFTPEADFSQILLTRAGTIYRVDLQALYESGATWQNIRLEAGDVVNVPDRQLNKIFVLGEVTKPGSYVMNKRRSTLAEALADAGFVNQLSSDPRYIFVMRGNVDKPEIFHLDAKSPDALLLADRFPLRPRDIVYVDAAEVARWNRVVTNILPTATLLNTISATQYPLFGGRQGQIR